MIYALIVAGLSLVGAVLPLRAKPGHAQLQIYLSLAAGALLGAGLFHMLPHSAEFIHNFGPPAAAGVIVVFLLQRYLAPHSHEVLPDECTANHDAEHAACGPPGHEGKGHQQKHSAGPFLTGLIAVLALSIHSLFDGIALGAATAPEADGSSLALSVFLSVLIHKPLDGLSVSVILMQAGVRRKTLWMVQIFYAALVPIGAVGFRYIELSMDDASMLVGYTLAFSGGTFLAIALTDLLPELHFHTHDRNKLSAALLLGLVVMWLTSLIGHGEHGHGHGHRHDHPAPAASKDGHVHDEHCDHDH